MTHLIGTLAAVLLLAGNAANEELAAASKKSTELASYSFKIDSKTEGGGRGKPVSTEGRYEKDQPIQLKSGGVEAFRKGGLVAVKEGETWKQIGKEKGDLKGKGGVNYRSLSAVKLPHEELTEFEKNFEKVEKAAEKENDCSVFSGPLTPAAAKALSASGRKKDDFPAAGTAKVWVNADGVIVKYEVSIKTKVTAKGAEVDAVTTRTVTLGEPGAAKVEVPEAAKKALEAQS